MNKTIKALIVSIFFAVIGAHSAYAAAGDLSVKISAPKSPTNQTNFNVNFVALDLLDRPVTVKCFKKGPSDSGFVQFGSDFNLAAGGNSDNCVVDNSIVNTNGTYQFYVQALAGSDSLDSSMVAVDYNTSGPGTPTSYSKEKINDCTWKIKFTTAPDAGKTVRVEAYRSSDASYNADSGNRFADIAIGSGQNGEVSITVPDCSKTWYFAVRAFDTAGNGSGVIGDSQNVTVTTNSTVTTTPTVAAGAIALKTGAGSSAGLETQGGPEASPTTEGTESSQNTQPGQPEVKGASTNRGSKLFYEILIGATLLGLGYVIFSKKNKK